MDKAKLNVVIAGCDYWIEGAAVATITGYGIAIAEAASTVSQAVADSIALIKGGGIGIGEAVAVANKMLCKACPTHGAAIRQAISRYRVANGIDLFVPKATVAKRKKATPKSAEEKAWDLVKGLPPKGRANILQRIIQKNGMAKRDRTEILENVKVLAA